MAFAKFEGNRLRIDGEIAENHAILVNLTASIGRNPWEYRGSERQPEMTAVTVHAPRGLIKGEAGAVVGMGTSYSRLLETLLRYTSFGSMLGQRPRRCPNIEPMLANRMCRYSCHNQVP